MILKKKIPYPDTCAKMLMEADQRLKSIHVRNCARKREFENIFSGMHLCHFNSCN